MNDIKMQIAKNITELRILNNMTQLDLANELNYSDKAVSKWERGESLPDVCVLAEISKLFNVKLDDLVNSQNIKESAKGNLPKNPVYNLRVVSSICEIFVFFLALYAFIITTLVAKNNSFSWLYFIYACPVFFIVKLVFNSIWFNKRHNYYIVSLLMWSCLAAIHITFLYFNQNLWLIYLLGAIGQIIILLWSFIKIRKK
ncbi:MAG: helix-turn-helix transcriptional regulator [Clostridia bacterium]|nr:helix-turn-helix transcriptional regulator [Clostridia bacterium]